MRQLYPHQIDAINWLKDKPKSILCLDAGLGKTAIATKTFKPDENILVICPATLKINWKKEIELWGEHDFNVNIIKKRGQELLPGINIINYDILGRRVGRKVEPCFDFKKFKANRVVLDECHYIKNPKSIRTKIAAKLVTLAKEAILLSGTLGERSMDLYVPLVSVGCIGMKMHEYGVTYCNGRKMYIGSKEVWDYRGNSNQDQLKELMKNHTLIMRKEEVVDLPPKTFKVISLDTRKGHREKNYNLSDILYDPRPIGFEGLAELLHEQSLIKLPLAIKHIKDRLESTKKLVVFAKHIDVIDALYEELKEFNPVKLDGRNSADQKDESVTTFQNDDECRVFIGQIKAAGVGITLTAASDVVFVETNWSYSDISQASDRCHRLGQKNNVYIEILTITNSIDERVLYTTLEKKQFTKEVLT